MRDYSDPRGGVASAVRARVVTGLVVGIVTDNAHGAQQTSTGSGDYRVRVKFPSLPSSQGGEVNATGENSDQSYWARVMTFGAAAGGVGLYFLPEIDSEVVCAFVHGDPDQPVVLGTVWNGVHKPAYSNVDGRSETDRFQKNDDKFKLKTEAKKNDVRSISSRQGHELLFNDNLNDPGVVLSSGQKHRIVLNDKDGAPTQIEIYDGREENYILIDTKNKKITVETKTGDILLKAKEKIRLEAKTIETESSAETKMKVGSNFEMSASANMTVKAGGQGEVKASGSLVIKGATVNIN